MTAGPGKSRGRFFYYARVSKIWGSFHSLSIRFLLTLIRTNSSYSCGDLFPENQHIEGLGESGAVSKCSDIGGPEQPHARVH
jgi:hypothetical protein